MESISAFMVGFFRAREAWPGGAKKENREIGEGESEQEWVEEKKESRLRRPLFLFLLESFEQAKVQRKRAKENGLRRRASSADAAAAGAPGRVHAGVLLGEVCASLKKRAEEEKGRRRGVKLRLSKPSIAIG